MTKPDLPDWYRSARSAFARQLCRVQAWAKQSDRHVAVTASLVSRTGAGAARLSRRAVERLRPLLQDFGTLPGIRGVVHALPLARSCISVAAANLLEQRLRLLAALSGITVALFLLLLQISILEAARAKVVALFNDFNFDLVVVPDTYQFLLSFDTLDRIVLNIAQGTGDVSATFGLNDHMVHWVQLPSKQSSNSFLIGLDDPGNFVLDPDIRSGWPSLRSPHAVLTDAYSQNSVGNIAPGTNAEIGDQRVTVTGQFKLGMFFYAGSAAIVRNTNFGRFSGRDSRMITMGLIQLKPGISPEKAKADLIKAVPSHILVMTRDELLRDERAYFLSTRPIGIIFYISMVIACAVGGAIIVQVLSTEVSNRMNEFAVFKAMGANVAFVYGIGMSQAALLGLGGLVPATLLGIVILDFIESRTHLGTAITASLLLTMLAITMALAAAASAAVVRRVQQADPAELY